MFLHTNFPLYMYFTIILSCTTGTFEAAAQPEIQEREGTLKPVESKYVCMVTDQLFKTPQISVVVNGRTYYGCCPGCVSRLKQDSSVRHAVDPITRDTVDKATAIIGVAADGEAFYFDSEANMRAYDPKAHEAENQHPKQR